MDRTAILEHLDSCAGVMRRFGLHGLTRAGRHSVKWLLNNELSVQFAGLQLRGPVQLRGQLYQIRSRQLEPLMSELFQAAISPGDVVLDVGASLGYYSLLAASRGGNVIAFEPDPRTLKYLERNIRLNSLSDRIRVEPKAVSNNAGTATFLLNDSPVLNSLFASPGEIEETAMVECVTIDGYLEETLVPSVIKLDIQGAEHRALLGMQQTITRATRPIAIFVECWPAGLQAAGSSAVELVQYLESLELNVRVLNEATGRIDPVPGNIEEVKYVNLYCTRGARA